MSASVAVLSADKPRNRLIEARRGARRAKFERERLIVDCLNRGVSVAEVAQRIGVTEKRMRALVKEILARRTPAAPEDFAALQVSRLNEALLVAYSAMSAENLRAVGLVVRIVRELDRYHGFVAAGRRPRRDPHVGADGREPLALVGDCPEEARPAPEKDCRRSPDAASEGEQVFVPASADAVETFAARTADRSEKVPQALEKMESAPGKGAVPNAPEGVSQEAEDAGSAQLEGVGAGSSNEAARHAAAPQSDHMSAAPCVGAETAPQAIENIAPAAGNGGNPAAAGPTEGASPHADVLATRGDAPGPASGAEPSLETVERV